MAKKWKPKLENRKYRGVSLSRPHERDLFDLRPMRFQALRGASAVDMLTELVNLPGNADALEVGQFIVKFHNLALGGTDSEGTNGLAMTRMEVIRLRGLYRQFWEVRSDPYRSMLFLRLIGPWPEARKSPIPNEKLPTHDGSSLFPMLDYDESALQMNWRTGRFKIVARGPVDWLTHAAFQNRNRLRRCAKCNRLFVGYGPNEQTCSQTCKLETDRRRKRKWWRKNRV